MNLAVLLLSMGILAAVPAYLALAGEDANAGSLEELDAVDPAESSELRLSIARTDAPAGEPDVASRRATARIGGGLDMGILGVPPTVQQPPAPAVPVRPARLSDTPTPASPPVSLAIADIGVRATVEGVGVDPASKQVEVPSERSTVAWYEHSPTPGEAGSSVLAAHVDFGGKPGAFYRLRNLEPGSVVTVGFADGSRQRFEVVARREFRKDELPRRRIFAKDGRAVLTLVTCGGGFNESDRSYDANVVVFAVPTGGGSG